MFVVRYFKTGSGRNQFPTQHETMLVAMIKQQGVNLNAKLEPEYMSLNLA